MTVDNIQRGSRMQNSSHHYLTSYVQEKETQSFSNKANDGTRPCFLWCPTREDIPCIAGLLDMCRKFASDICSSALAPDIDFCIISLLSMFIKAFEAQIISYNIIVLSGQGFPSGLKNIAMSDPVPADTCKRQTNKE